MQTDKGIVLATALVQELRQEKLILPPLKVIERICALAITRANRKIYLTLTETLNDGHRAQLEGLLWQSCWKLRQLSSIKPSICRPAAEADVAEAAQWYNERQLGLGEKFVREVDQAIVRILENPLAFPVILRRHEVRRILTKRFPIGSSTH